MLGQARSAIAAGAQPRTDDWEAVGAAVDRIAEQWKLAVAEVWGALLDLERDLLAESGCSSLARLVSGGNALSGLGDRIAGRLSAAPIERASNQLTRH